MGLLTAYYDPLTDNIVGAVRGSYAWFHEQRHREQYERGVAQKADQLHVWLYYAAFLAGPVGAWFLGLWGWFVGVGMAFTPHVFALAFLELDAYVVGSYRWFIKKYL